MTSAKIQEIRDRIAAKVENTKNTDDVLELSLKELSVISGGLICYTGGGAYCNKAN